MRESWFEGQYCFHCKEPIWGRGCFDVSPDGTGLTSYHMDCHEKLLGGYLGSCVLIRLDKLTESPDINTGWAYTFTPQGKMWHFELKFDGKYWRDAGTQGILKFINNEHFLLIRIDDD